MSFLIASLMVDEPSHPPPAHHVNATSANASLVNDATPLKVTHHSHPEFLFDPPFSNKVRGEIEHYLLFLSVPAIITFIMAALYFPSKPPTPPSNSAKVNQTPLCKVGLLLLSPFFFWPGSTFAIPSWGHSTSEKPKLLGHCSGLGDSPGSLEQLVCSHGYLPH